MTPALWTPSEGAFFHSEWMRAKYYESTKLIGNETYPS